SAAAPITAQNIARMPLLLIGLGACRPTVGNPGQENFRKSLGRNLGVRRSDEARQLEFVERGGAEEALIEIAAPVGEESQLRGAFHAFDDDLEIELACQLNHRLDDNPVAAAADDVGNQAAVDLER